MIQAIQMFIDEKFPFNEVQIQSKSLETKFLTTWVPFNN